MRKMMLPLAFAASMALVVLAADVSSPTLLREFKVSRKHFLQLQLPSDWQADERHQDGLLHLEFKPQAPDDFTILISAVTPIERDRLGTPEEIQSFVRLMGTSLLSTAVEKELTMLHVQGVAGDGYFYLLTDARQTLPDGEYRFMCQGLMAIGDFRLSVTILTHTPDQQFVKEVLQILKDARDVPKRTGTE